MSNVAQNESDPAAPQEPHASNAGGIESSTPLMFPMFPPRGRGRRIPPRERRSPTMIRTSSQNVNVTRSQRILMK
jgi:hypothetical protein